MSRNEYCIGNNFLTSVDYNELLPYNYVFIIDNNLEHFDIGTVTLGRFNSLYGQHNIRYNRSDCDTYYKFYYNCKKDTPGPKINVAALGYVGHIDGQPQILMNIYSVPPEEIKIGDFIPKYGVHKVSNIQGSIVHIGQHQHVTHDREIICQITILGG